MGALIITDTQFSFEWDSEGNSTPPGSADLPTQQVLQNIQHWGEEFFYDVEPSENTTPPGSANLPQQQVLQNMQHWGEEFISAIVLEENSTPPGSATLPAQPVLQNIQHWGEEFFYVLLFITKKTFYIHVQDLAKRPLKDVEIIITDLDHPEAEPVTLHTNKFGNAVFISTTISRYKFELSKKYWQRISCELGLLTSQPAVRGVRTLMQEFKTILRTMEDEEPVS